MIPSTRRAMLQCLSMIFKFCGDVTFCTDYDKCSMCKMWSLNLDAVEKQIFTSDDLFDMMIPTISVQDPS